MSETTIAIAIAGYVLLLVGICWREVRIRKRIRAERRQEIEDAEYAAYQREMDEVHDEQGIQRDGQEVG